MSLKVAIVIEHFDASRGGAENLTYWLCGELAKRGVEVHVVCHDVGHRINKYRAATQRASHDRDRSHSAHVKEADLPDGVKVHRLRGIKLNTAIGFRRFGKRARSWCEKSGVDVVHSMTVAYPGDLYHPHAGVYAEIHEQAVASRPTGAKATFKRLMLRLSPKQRTLIGMEKRAAKEPAKGGKGGVRKILSICLMMTQQFERVYGVGAERFILLENPRMGGMPDVSKQAEDRAWFRGHYGLSENDRVALFVGHDFRRKGLRWAIDAMASTKSNWKLVVAGLGKVREYVEHVERAGLTERVKFIGPTREMGKVYAAGDALLLPTFYDSFGLVVVEALAHGIPVVSTEFLGAADLVRRNEVGWIVESPRNVAGMAKALDEFPVSGRECAELAARCRRAAEGMPGENYVERVIEIYRAIIAEKKLSE